MTSTNLLEEAKKRLPLCEVMGTLGFGDRAKKSARCPFHDDTSASFSFYTGDDGEQHWHCFAGCGQGDVIDFIAKHGGLTNAEACRKFIDLAGLSHPVPAPVAHAAPGLAQVPFDWTPCVGALTKEQRLKLAEWRGYSPKTVEWLHGQQLVGMFQGHVAFPVHDEHYGVIGCHYRLEDGSWRYHPTGTRTRLIIIGEPAKAEKVFVFESQWDLLAAVDALHHHIRPLAGTVLVATRGASNGRLLTGVCPQAAVVYAFGQNDRPGQQWVAAVAAHSACKTLSVATPAPHKDLNEWRRSGGTTDEIRAAIATAQLHAQLDPEPPVQLDRCNDQEDTMEAPQPFPVDSLPPALAGIVNAVVRCESVPAALPAVCALGVFNAAIGSGLEIASATDRVTKANLFLLGAAESGSGKSQVFRRIAEPLIEHQHESNEIFRVKTAPALESEIGLLTREIKRLENKAANDRTSPEDRDRLLGELAFKNARRCDLMQKQVPPCTMCADVTSEKLAVLLAANKEVLFSASPEARQIVDIVCGRYSATKNSDEAIYLSGFSGDLVRVDRLGREPVTLHHPCLSVLWLIQPDAMARLFETDSLTQSGFLPRFLICHTHAEPRKITEGEEQVFSDAIRNSWAECIRGLLSTYHEAETPFRVQSSLEAKRAIDSFFNEVVERRAGDLSDVGQFASRYAEQVWRVALNFHAALHGAAAYTVPLHLVTAEQAIVVVKWFVQAQLGVLARGRQQAATAKEDEVLGLIASNRQRKNQDFTTARELQQAHIVSTAEAARVLLARMEKTGLLLSEEIRPEGGGWTRHIYRTVNNPINQ